MSKVKSYADLVAEWDTLLGNLAGEESLAGLSNQPKLQAIVDRFKAYRVQQIAQAAAKQEASQALNALILEGKDVARDLKSEIKAKFGARSEKLVRYSVKPLRASARQSRIKAGSPSTAPEPAPAVPAVSGSTITSA